MTLEEAKKHLVAHGFFRTHWEKGMQEVELADGTLHLVQFMTYRTYSCVGKGSILVSVIGPGNWATEADLELIRKYNAKAIASLPEPCCYPKEISDVLGVCP